MKRNILFSIVIFLGISLALCGNTPFTENKVLIQQIGEIPTSVSDFINSDSDSEKFPVTGTVQAGSSLRFRSWPWGPVLGLKSPGSKLKIIGISGEFYQVEIDGKTAYMHKNYISVPGQDASQEEPYYPGNTRAGGYIALSESKLSTEVTDIKAKIETIEKKYDQAKKLLALAKSGYEKQKDPALKEKITDINKLIAAIENKYDLLKKELAKAKKNLAKAQEPAPKKTSTKKASSSSKSSSSSSTSSSSEAEKALANYKGGKLSPAEFGRLFGPVARENMKKTGVPASVTLAQAALETGWGGSSIGDAKNLFGIKGTGPAGTIKVPTKEFVNGRMITIQDNFRKYNSWQESIEDHGKLLQNSRYGYALKYNKDPNRYAKEIHKAGYATDPNYASKLISIMKSNNFYQYDI